MNDMNHDSDKVRAIIFGITFPFTFNSICEVITKQYNINNTIIANVLSDLCSSGMLICKNNIFYCEEYRFINVMKCSNN